jgi:Family of unknown function (DUF6282)
VSNAVDLTGAVDLHCHFGPDAHRSRSVTAIEAVAEARAAGHAAVVLKSHDQPTTLLAWALDQFHDNIRVFGGICCDREVGGVNPAAVEAALRTGAKVVWLPTLSSEQDQRNGVAAQLGIPGPGCRVVDDKRELTADARAVLDLVAEHDAVLATGHISADEHVAVARAFGRRGRVLVTHAMEELAGPDLTIAQCMELADMGATVELCAMTCIGALATRKPAELAACAQAVGPARCTLATDYGQQVNPRPAAGLQGWADALLAEGLSGAEVRRMACTNPAALIGL